MKSKEKTTPKSTYTIPELSPELERGPGWLRDRRRVSSAKFNETPLPARGLHLWRYTDPTSFVFDGSESVDSSAGDNFKVVKALEFDHLKDGSIAGLISDIGGRNVECHGLDSLREKGLIACSLSEAAEKHFALFEQYLYRLVSSQTGKFEALNSALWNDGIFIYVPDGMTIDKPLHLLREAGTENSLFLGRLLVVVGKNARLVVIDEYGGGSTDRNKGISQANSAVELFAHQDSRVTYLALQRQTSAMNSYLTHRAWVDRGAQMLTIPLVFGGAVSKQNFGVDLAGKGADSRIVGLTFGSGRQHLDTHTLHLHSASNTSSYIDFKVVLKDRALSAYTGLIRIENDAKTCEAYQENRNLLLDAGARAETIPELEILNEDVSCSHGATIGPIDPEQVFYLRSRGVDTEEATRMIVSGFIAKTLARVPEDLRIRLTEFVAQRLETI